MRRHHLQETVIHRAVRKAAIAAGITKLVTPHRLRHCIVTAGGLDDDGHWVPARSRFLFPVKAMSKVSRGKLLDGFAELNKKQKLTLEGHCADLAPTCRGRVRKPVTLVRSMKVRAVEQGVAADGDAAGTLV